MKIRLLLKQSIKDFESKKILYFIFMIFLAVGFCIITGLHSFYIAYTNKIDQAERTLSKIAFNNYPKFASSNKLNDSSFEGYIDKNDNIYQFVYKIIDSNYSKDLKIKELKNNNKLEKTIKNYIDFIGSNNGELLKYQKLSNNSNEFIIGQKLFEHFSVEQIKNIATTTRSISNNLFAEYILNSDLYKTYDHQLSWNSFYIGKDFLGSNDVNLTLLTDLKEFNSSEVFNKINFASKDRSMIIIDSIYDINKLSKDLKTKYFDKRNYVFVSPHYLKKYNLKLGLIYKFSYNKTIYETLILGSGYKADSTDENLVQNVLLSSKLYYQIILQNRLSKLVAFNSKITNNYIEFEKLLDKDFMSIKKGLSVFKNHTYTFNVSIRSRDQQLKIIILILILMVILIIVTFYFISELLIQNIKDKLFILKSLGVNKIQLATLASFSSFIPLIVAFIIGISLSFSMKSIFINVNSDTFSFVIPKFNIPIQTIIFVSLLTLLMFIIFILATSLHLSTRKFSFQNALKSKTPNLLYQKFNRLIWWAKPNIRITTSFIFKNIYKNITTFLILIISFSLLLFSIQFTISITQSTNSIISRYKPYKSVKLTDNNLFYSTTINENKIYKPSYQTISSKEQLDELKQIKTIDDLVYMLINTTFNKQIVKNYPIDLKQYLLDKQFIHSIETSEFKDLIDQIVNKLDDFKSKNLNWSNRIDQLKQLIIDNQKTIQIEFNKIQNIIKEQRIVVANINNKYTNTKIALPVNFLFGKSVAFNSNKDYLSFYNDQINLTQIIRNNKIEKIYLYTKFLSASYKDKLAYDFILKNNFINKDQLVKDSRTITNENIKINNQYKNLPVLNVVITNKMADYFYIKRNDILKLTPSFVDLKSDFYIYAKVNQISKKDSLYNAIYFDKQDYFNLLLEYKNHLNKNSLNSTKNNLKEQLETIISQINDDHTTLNNISFSTSSIPTNIRYFTIPIMSFLSFEYNNKFLNITNNTNSDGSQITNYWPEKNNSFLRVDSIENSAIIRLLKSIDQKVYNFEILAKILKSNVFAMSSAIKQTRNYIVVVMIVVIMILVLLILYENKKVIILLKSIGYKKFSIIKYFISGYFIGASLALLISFIIVKKLIEILSYSFATSYGIGLEFLLTKDLVLIGILVYLVFVVLVLISISFFIRKQSVTRILEQT
ncbi:ABC transporter permease [Mycoplasma feriruminatoris]|uniref:ABC transporter permease n=1 Tax=Mycoplasma feriruminatoris TaxID=1179777 RepID=UPI0002A4CFAD|nr:ABC transporter permease [Mycoplasma feriruminatoris]UKS54383.1 ftsX-like permease family protein [Mycoplasma feriruminatoris]